jgi:CheY-like chemotaxis protein
MGEMLPYILLAEDDPEDRDLLTGELERQNIFVIFRIVNEGAELLSFLADCTSNDLPALILLDYNMPKLMAPDVLKELSKHSRYKAFQNGYGAPPTARWISKKANNPVPLIIS